MDYINADEFLTHLQQPFFLTDVFILKCRHLKRIHIPISAAERKHLILTGNNGSGKSSVLEAIKNSLKEVGTYFSNHAKIVADLPVQYARRKAELELPDEQIKNQDFKEWAKDYLLDNQFQQEAAKAGIGKFYDALSLSANENIAWSKLGLTLNNQTKVIFPSYNFFVQQKFLKFPFLTTYISAQRNFDFLKNQPDKSTDTFKFQEQGINSQASAQFIHYLMQKKIQQAFASLDENIGEVQKVKIWFVEFEKLLKVIFKDESLKLTFQSQQYYFLVHLLGREPVSLEQLSDGFKSIVYILAEILMRIEKISLDLANELTMAHSPDEKQFFEQCLAHARPETIQGVVIIDEVETHLHIDLQKQILPFLTSFFPNIQFIVSSHSPYVLSSIDNAVVYDLQNNNFIDEPLVGFPAEAIVETHFEVDKFSNFLNQIKTAYENLLSLEQPTKKDIQMLQKLRNQLQEMPKFRAAEIKILLAETKELYQAKISSYDKLP